MQVGRGSERPGQSPLRLWSVTMPVSVPLEAHAAPRRLSPLGDHAWPADQPFWWAPLSLPREDPLSGLVPEAPFKHCLCFFFFLECRTTSWFPRPGILRVGSGLCSTSPSSVSAGPWPELRAARHLGPGSASALPRPMHQESQAGPVGHVSPARILGGGGVCCVPRKQRPLQRRPLTRSLHFFSKQKFSL